MKSWPAKDPDEVADFDIVWTLDDGDSIASSTWAFNVQAGLAKDSDSYSGSQTKIWLSGGTHGETGVLTNSIVTAAGRTFEESVTLAIVSTYPPQVLTPGYIIPTPATLKMAFPAFAAVPDATVQLWINQAATMVDNTWFETDYAMAIILLACHYMVGAGLGTGAEAKANANGMGGYQTVRSGQLTLSRGSTSQSDNMGEFGSTLYGRRFYWMLRRNKPGGVAAVGPACDVGGHPWWNGIFIAQGRFP